MSRVIRFRPALVPALAAFCCIAVLAAPARADLTPSSSLLLDVRYARDLTGDIDRDDFDVRNVVAAGMRSRHYFGRGAGWCTGLDGEIGGSDGGLVYDVEAYALGGAFPLGEEGILSLCGGAGLGGVRGTIPFAFQFPAELAIELQTGPVRTFLWGRLRWVLGEDARKEGSDVATFADELDAGFGLRFGRNSKFWRKVTAGHGLYVGLTYREQFQRQFIGAVVGVSLWGGNR